MTEASRQPESGTGGFDPRAYFLFGLGILLLTVAAFGPVVHYGFINWDDPDYFSNNSHLKSPALELIEWCFTTTYMGHYQPLNWLSYAIDFRLWGLDPGRFHLTQAILHGFAAVCLFTVTLQLLQRTRSRANAETRYVAAAGAALFFSLHPLRVESVAWLSARADILAAILSMLCVVAYLKNVERSRRGGLQYRFPVLAFLFYLLAILSKEMAISLPAVLVVLDVYPLGRLPASPGRWGEQQFRHAWREKAPFFLLAVVAALFAFRAAGSEAVATMSEHPLPTRMAQAAVSLMFYLRQTIAPAELSPLYEFPPGFGPTHALALGSIGGLLVLLVVLWLIRHRAPGLVAAAVCYAIIILPVSGLTQRGPQMVADRYSYMGCIPWAVAAGFLFAYGLMRMRWVAVIGLIGLFALMIVRTQGQLAYWGDSETLWQRAIAVDPSSGGAHAHLAHAWEVQGRGEEALGEYRRGLSLGWRHYSIHRNMAAILARLGRYEEAIPEYLADIEQYPGRWESCFYLAVACERVGDLARASEQYREALRQKPDLVEGHVSLARLFMEHGYDKEAEPRLRYALSLEPTHLEAMERLSILCARTGNSEEATALLTRCIAEAERRGEIAVANGLRGRRREIQAGTKP